MNIAIKNLTPGQSFTRSMGTTVMLAERVMAGDKFTRVFYSIPGTGVRNEFHTYSLSTVTVL